MSHKPTVIPKVPIVSSPFEIYRRISGESKGRIPGRHLTTVLAAALLITAGASRAAEPPNILFIFCDDLAHHAIHTPLQARPETRKLIASRAKAAGVSTNYMGCTYDLDDSVQASCSPNSRSSIWKKTRSSSSPPTTAAPTSPLRNHCAETRAVTTKAASASPSSSAGRTS